MTDTAALTHNLGPSLRRWRLLNRLKQSALAADLGVSQARISRWENGQAHPGPHDQARLVTLLRARPTSAADRALAELVTASQVPVHLVCDLTHRLLAASPARCRDWHVPLNDLIGTPLWRFATEGIARTEATLGDQGWFDPVSPDVTFVTERRVFREITIRAGEIRVSRLPLSDGSFVRLVRDGARQAAA